MYIYILYTYVLQLIINSTMYTIVPVCVLFSNFFNINAVYMYFYPDTERIACINFQELGAF